MTIPDKYIRIACISAINAQFINAGVTCPIYDTQVPKSIAPIPGLRVILSTQTKRQANTTKCGHDWAATLLFDIINEQPQGYSDRTVVENIEELIDNALDTDIDLNIPPFVVYNTQVLDSHDMSLETPVKSIDRKLVRYQWILGLPTPTGEQVVDLTFENLIANPIINRQYNNLRPNIYVPIPTDTIININGTVSGDTGQIELDYVTGNEIVTFNGLSSITSPGTPGIITASFINHVGTLTFS